MQIFTIPQGPPGTDGTDGTDGVDGTDGNPALLQPLLAHPRVGPVITALGTDRAINWNGGGGLVQQSGTALLAGLGIVETVVTDSGLGESVNALQVERDAAGGGPSVVLSFFIPIPNNWTAWGATGVQLRTSLATWSAGAGTTTVCSLSLRNPAALGAAGAVQQTLARANPTIDGAVFVDLGITKAALDALAFAPGRVLAFDLLIGNTIGGTATPRWQFSRLTVDWT